MCVYVVVVEGRTPGGGTCVEHISRLVVQARTVPRFRTLMASTLTNGFFKLFRRGTMRPERAGVDTYVFWGRLCLSVEAVAYCNVLDLVQGRLWYGWPAMLYR
jgi:hypothetical protein